jgi:predicted DNA binding CopG/RHH family protein
MKKEYEIKKLKVAESNYLKRMKASVTRRLDAAVIQYFKSLSQKTGIPYQSLINFVLRDYAVSGLKPSSN